MRDKGNLASLLRVGVPRDLLRLSGGFSHAQVWSNVVERMPHDISLRPLSSWRFGQRLQRLDIHLSFVMEADLSVKGPYVAQLYDAGWATPELRDTLNENFVKELEQGYRKSFERAEAVIAPSVAVAEGLYDLFDMGDIPVYSVSLGVDTSQFHPHVGSAATVLRRMGADPDRPYVLYVSSVHPRKNLFALREAMATLAREGAPHQLVMVLAIAPDRPDSSDLVCAATADLPGAPDRVFWATQVPSSDLALLMAGAAVYCQPSLYEGFGMPTLEAMACGTPVVVSDRGSLPEVAGDAGVVVEPTPEGITSGLRLVLNNSAVAEDMGKRGVERAKLLTWRRCSDGWAEVLQRTLGVPTDRIPHERRGLASVVRARPSQ